MRYFCTRILSNDNYLDLDSMRTLHDHLLLGAPPHVWTAWQYCIVSFTSSINDRENNKSTHQHMAQTEKYSQWRKSYHTQKLSATIKTGFQYHSDSMRYYQI